MRNGHDGHGGHGRTAPSGTVVFFFSDIEGSTHRWERFGDGMAAALRRHDELVRSAIERHNGYVFKTIGDAFCAAFPTAAEAVAGALDAQRSLAREDFSAVEGIRIRVALHAGAAEERDGDYFGPTVNRVARLLATTWAGQTILSSSAASLARPWLPAGATLRELGTHYLKDIAEPEAIAQLTVPDLPAEFPPLRSLAALRHNLPAQLPRLIGRDGAISEIEGLLGGEVPMPGLPVSPLVSQRPPLVSLVGAGGIGKTSIALHVGTNVLERFAGGVWYVELASLADEALVAAEIVRALGLREAPGRSALETLLLSLASRSALVILDNCEHVLGEVARVAAQIVQRCPDIRVLATSREPLGVRGEAVVRVPPLAFPPAVGVGGAAGVGPGVRAGVDTGGVAALRVDEAMRYEAIALFVERASALDARFALTAANAALVGDICRRLDGIALAIELAASRTSILPVPLLAKKLDERFRLLTGGQRGALPHHQTLHATIAWSYDLLSAREQTILRRLGIFAEAWSLEAALAVCAGGDGDGDGAGNALDEFEIIDAIEALVAKSLVTQVNEAPGTGAVPAYRLLESTRAFALLRLKESDEYDALRRRQAVYAVQLAERLDVAYVDTPDAEWNRAALEAIADLRAALGWSLEDGSDVALGAELVANLRWFWRSAAPIEGDRFVRSALSRGGAAGVAPSTLAKLQTADALLGLFFNDFARQAESARVALERFRELGDELESAIALRLHAQALRLLGRVEEGVAGIEESLAEFRRLRCPRFVALSLDVLGVHHNAAGKYEQARAEFEEAIAIARSTGFERGLLLFEINLAELEFANGKTAQAIELGESAVGRRYEIRDAGLLAAAWGNLAMYYASLERWPDARNAAGFAIAFAREVELELIALLALQTFAAAAAHEGDPSGAARALGYVDVRLAALGVEREFTEDAQYRGALAVLASRLGAEALARLLASGDGLSQDAALALAGVGAALLAVPA